MLDNPSQIRTALIAMGAPVGLTYMLDTSVLTKLGRGVRDKQIPAGQVAQAVFDAFTPSGDELFDLEHALQRVALFQGCVKHTQQALDEQVVELSALREQVHNPQDSRVSHAQKKVDTLHEELLYWSDKLDQAQLDAQYLSDPWALSESAGIVDATVLVSRFADPDYQGVTP